MSEFIEPLDDILWTVKGKANRTNQEQPITWDTINKMLNSMESPSISYDSFEKDLNSQTSPTLSNLLHSDVDSYNEAGILLRPDNKPISNDDQPLDQDNEVSRSAIKSSAARELKRKK